MWEWCGPYSSGRNAGCCVNGLARAVTYPRILFQATIKSPRRSLLVGVNLVVFCQMSQ